MTKTSRPPSGMNDKSEMAFERDICWLRRAEKRAESLERRLTAAQAEVRVKVRSIDAKWFPKQ